MGEFVEVSPGCRVHVDVLEDPEFVDEDPQVLDLFSKMLYTFDEDAEGPLFSDHAISLEENGAPNPFFNKVMKILDRREQLEMIQQEIKDRAANFQKAGRSYKNAVDFAALMEELSDLEELYNQIYDEFESEPVTESIVPPHPVPGTLYSRVEEEEEVYDIGCGTGEKLDKFAAHLQVSGCDPKATENTDYDKQPFGEVDEEKFSGKILTSFNTLTQLDSAEFERVTQHDGIHVLPDVEELQKIGVSKFDEETGRFVCKDRKGVLWHDYDHPIEHGTKLTPGFRGVNFYKQRTINLMEVGKGETGDTFKTYTTPGVMIAPDVSYKIDGVQVEITIFDDKYEKRYRNGKIEHGIVSGDRVRLQFLAEEVGSSNQPFMYVPTRILTLNGFVPFHSGSELRNFADKFKIKINGVPVVGPSDFDGHMIINKDGINGYEIVVDKKKRFVPIDGKIYRGDVVDHYDKFVWTFDCVDLNEILEMLEKEGKAFVVDEFPPEGSDDKVKEFSVIHSSLDGFRITFTRLRDDKMRGNHLRHIRGVFSFVESAN